MRLPRAACLLALAAAWLPPGPAGAADEPAPAPRIAFDREEHDFGVAAQEQELTTEFTVRNEGDAPLKDLKTLADCGCYGVTLSALEIPPGGSASLKVTFRTLLMSGPLSKRLSVRSSDPKRPDVALHLKVLVGAGVVVDPGRLFFGDVLVGAAPSKEVFAKWLEGVGRPFRVLGVEVPGHAQDLAVEMEPHEEKQALGRDAEGKPVEGTWKGTRIRVSFTKPPPIGTFSSTALIRTDHPDYPRIALPLTAIVSGRVWVQSRTVTFGWVKAGESKRSTIAVRPFSKEVDLGRVTAKVRGGRVAAEVTREPAGPQPGWRLVVSVPADAPPGRLDDVIELRTEVPGEELTEIQVRGEVLPGGR